MTTRNLPASNHSERGIGWRIWLALLPVSLIIGPLSILGLGGLRKLSSTFRWGLWLYAVGQFLPAFLAPSPMLALTGAGLRIVLTLGLIGVGAQLTRPQALAPVGLGLMAVYLTAIIAAVQTGQDAYTTRLAHPYMTSTTVGLAGAFGLWLSIFTGLGVAAPIKDLRCLPLSWLLRLPWRVLLGLAGLLMLLASGSRGALLAAVAGIVVGILQRLWQTRSQAAATTAFTTVVATVTVSLVAIWLGQRFDIGALNRLGNAALTGRDLVWATTLEVVRAYPLGGVGSYQLGSFLQPVQVCRLWSDTPCPDWLSQIAERFSNPWLIAHNGFLQQLAETGPLGAASLMALLGAALTAGLKSRQPLLLAIMTGLLVGSLTDNFFLVPSPFFAELFWVAAGMAAAQWAVQVNASTTKSTDMHNVASTRISANITAPTNIPWLIGTIGTAVTLYLAAPIWLNTLVPPLSPKSIPELLFISAPRNISDDNTSGQQPYEITFQLAGEASEYRAVLQSCTETCVTVASREVQIVQGHTELITLSAPLRLSAYQVVSLSLYPAQSAFGAPALAERRWIVERQTKL